MKQLTRIFALAGLVTLAAPLGTVTGEVAPVPSPRPVATQVTLATQANNDFAFDLYGQLAKQNAGKNVFFSPYSMSSALAMTAEGARGKTAGEMGKVLRFPQGARRQGDEARLLPWRMSLIHTGMAAINARLNAPANRPELKEIRLEIEKFRAVLKSLNDKAAALREQRRWREADAMARESQKVAAKLNRLLLHVDQYEIRVANSLWGEKTYPFRDAYIKTISRYYKTDGVFAVDFKSDPEGNRKRINAWVEERTNQRIKDLLKPLMVNRLTRLVLTNAIYFKGQWAEPFEERMTKPRDFTLADGKKRKIAMMNVNYLGSVRYAAFHADGSFFQTPQWVEIRGGPGSPPPPKPKAKPKPRYPDKDGLAVIELPYKGGALSMVVIAPNRPDGLPGVEKKLTAKTLAAWVGKLAGRTVNVFLPEFRLETDYSMKPTLQALGMVRAFEDPRDPTRGAQFGGMTDSRDPLRQLYITHVVHKAFVDVNEKGTEAAVATAVAMAPGEAPVMWVPFIPTFKADRPFLFLIRDRQTGCILFLGRVTDPAAK